MFVYKIKNKINGKYYIGQTIRSIARKGKPPSTEHKIAISNGLKKPIICNETGKVYASIKEAAAALGGNPSGIWFVLTKPNRTFKGFTFSYFPQHE